MNGLWTNQAMAKALVTGSMGAGGSLLAEQQNQFIRFVLGYSQLLAPGSGIRTRTVGQAAGQLEKLFMHGPVVQGANSVFTSGAVDNGEGGGIGAVGAEVIDTLYDEVHDKFGLLKYDCQKMVARKGWSTEFLRENVEGKSIESRLRSDFLPRIATDFEDLAINGNSALDNASTQIDYKSPRGNLLKVNDGWDKLTESAISVDVKGAFLSGTHWESAVKHLPRWLRRNRPNLKWIFNDDIEQDWISLLSMRQDGLGAAAVSGQAVNPMGIPYQVASMIPSDKELTITEALGGIVDGQRPGPFTFVKDSADQIIINVDSIAAKTIDFSAGGGGVPVNTGSFTLTTPEVCAVINSVFVADVGNYGPAFGNVAQPDPVYDTVILKSPNTGANKDIDVTVPAQPCLDLLGLGLDNDDGLFDAARSGDGAALGSNKFREGTFAWLCDPSVLSFVAVTSDAGANGQGIRSYSEFNKDRDRTEMIVYAYTDALCEDPQGVVKINNLRTQSLIPV